MKITEKILSLPPWLSTSWDQVTSIKVDGQQQLIVALNDGSSVTIPGLDQNIMDKVFEAHSKALEIETQAKSTQIPLSPLEAMSQMAEKEGAAQTFPLNIDFPFTGALDGQLTALLKHNPDESDADNLPEEIIEKIEKISSVFTDEEREALPKPEKNCNCFHCQIVKAMYFNEGEEEIEAEEDEVTEDDLRFREWNISKTGENLYTVVNPFDNKEHYSVFLGEPVGCTCGQKDCEHIKAVLYS
jgi:hypothetical protein